MDFPSKLSAQLKGMELRLDPGSQRHGSPAGRARERQACRSGSEGSPQGKVFNHLLSLENLTLEDRPCQAKAVAGLRAGLVFADTLNHASCRSWELIASH